MSKCRSCNAEILWMKTSNGKNIPVDYDQAIAKEKNFNFQTMKSHFSTCPDADKYRNPNA